MQQLKAYPPGMRVPARPAVAPVANSLFRPSNLELGLLILLILFYLFADAILGAGSESTVNVVGPLVLMLALAWGIVLMVREDSRSILTPLLMFRASTLVHFGFGSLVPLIVSDSRRLMLEGLYRFSDEDMARFNFLIACSVFIIIGLWRVMQSAESRRVGVQFVASYKSAPDDRLKYYGILFSGVGYSVKYLILFPAAMGWLPDNFVSGAVGVLGNFSLVGIFLLTLWVLRVRTSFLPGLVLLVAADIAMGVVLLTKTEALTPLLSFLLAIIAHKASRLRVVVALLCVFSALEVMQPLVAYGRDELWKRSAGMGTLPLLDRIDIIASYWSGTGQVVVQEEAGLSLLRLSYVNAGTLAMRFYDNGIPGDSLSEWYVVLIPRILWPDKPIIQPGKEFARQATLRDAENSVAPGVFAEAYWNSGWFGTLTIMPLLALQLYWLSQYVMWVLRGERWLYLPVAFLCMRMGSDVAGWLVGSYLGAAMFVIALHFGANALTTLLDRMGIDSRKND